MNVKKTKPKNKEKISKSPIDNFLPFIENKRANKVIKKGNKRLTPFDEDSTPEPFISHIGRIKLPELNKYCKDDSGSIEIKERRNAKSGTPSGRRNGNESHRIGISRRKEIYNSMVKVTKKSTPRPLQSFKEEGNE